MAKIVVPRNQQEESRRLHPKPHYSRVLSMKLPVFQGWGATYACTPPVGDRVWLLGIKVWSLNRAIDQSQVSFFRVITGTVQPKSLEDVYAWTNILPLVDEAGKSAEFLLYDGMPGFEWSIMMFFEGHGRRFGAYAARVGEDVDVLQISFEISEG